MKSLKSIGVCFIFLSLMLPAMSQSIQSDAFLSEGVKLHYVTAGSGTPLILIHGFSDDISICYQHPLDAEGTTFISKLAKNYKVIALDVKGHGKSDKPLDADRYGKVLEEDVIRLMDHLGVKKAHILGYSMGAFITGNLLVNHPERLLSATLIGGSPLTQAQYSPEHGMIQAFDATAETLRNENGMVPLLQWFWPSSQSPTSEEIEQMSKEVLEGQDSQALGVCVYHLKELLQIEEEKLIQSEIPVTLINGTDDPLWHEVAPFQRLKRTTSIVLEGANHLDILMRPECLEAVEKSLALVDLQLRQVVNK